MIKLISTGYTDNNSCEEIFLDDCFNVIKRIPIAGIKNASFVAIKDDKNYFVSEESREDAKVYEVSSGKVMNLLELPTAGVVYLSFLEKCGIIISGSYTFGDVTVNNENKFKVGSAHCVIPDEYERFLYVTDIKADRIFIYDLTDFYLVDELVLPDNTGPRHLKFYNGFLYLVTEYSNEIYVFSHNSFSGKLELINKYSSILGEYDGVNFAAAIDIKDDILAVSNRGKNVISIFRVLQNGSLTALYEFDCGGDWPRDIKFFRDYLLVANERSGEICVFNTNDNNGKLVSRIEKKGVNFIYLTEGDFYGL